VEGRAREAAAALIRERAPAILPRVIDEAIAGDASSLDPVATKRRLTAYLEARIPLWIAALAATDEHRDEAIARLLRMDNDAGADIPPVVILGTIAIGYRVIEQELRLRAADYGQTSDELWTEVDILRRTVMEMRRHLADDGRVA
jgi:hypothetical protein